MKPASEWKPEWKHVDVETPPEPGGGTLFLVWVEGELLRGPELLRAAVAGNRRALLVPEHMIAYFDASEEWREATTEETVELLTDGAEVTHWMELPPPPGADFW